MMSLTDSNSLPRGIHRSIKVPEPSLGALWDSIIIDEKTKQQLVNQAVVNFSVRKKIPRSVLPLHGVLLLVGQPGTGKTSLARGLAHKIGEIFPKDEITLLEVEPHSLTSSAMGKTQQAVSSLFSQSIAESAISGPTIVLLDEVETLAADRSKLSLEANPIDIHRATDAVLVQLDLLAESHPQLLFIATSNFPDAVDSAFTSRCDLVIEIPLPNKGAIKKILEECLAGLSQVFNGIGDLINSPRLDECASACMGLDGRAIRKMVANAIASRRETAIDPNKLLITDLFESAETAKSSRLRKVTTK